MLIDIFSNKKEREMFVNTIVEKDQKIECLETVIETKQLSIQGRDAHIKELLVKIDELESKVDENKIRLLQYDNLRKNFNTLVDAVLGEDYYNEAHDVYCADEFTCRDLRDTFYLRYKPHKKYIKKIKFNRKR